MDFDNADTISIATLALEEDLQQERANEISELNRLSKKVCHLHTSILYYRNSKSKIGTVCYETWRTLIRKVGGSSDCWLALGHQLGVSRDDLDYIKNSVKEDPTDIILKLYLRDENATLDKILEAFTRLKRYDILKALEKPICDLAQCFNKDDSKSDTGYVSTSKNTGQKEIVSLKLDILNELPPALHKNYILTKKEPNRQRPLQKKMPLKPVEKVKNDKPILFLTFAEDGYETALNIMYKVQDWPEEFNVSIITLNEMKEDVHQNPEKFIREYFDKADFIVPIITVGYLEEIASNKAVIPNTSDNLDYKYVKFIYNLIACNYMHSGCLNKKVRSLLPECADLNVLTSITMYPDLMPWTFEPSFDEQFQVFLEDYCKSS